MQPQNSAASGGPPSAALNSDRPESDSEDSEDETPAVPTQTPQKMPRAGGATAPDMRRSGTGGPAAQKVPRKAMPGPAGRKSVARGKPFVTGCPYQTYLQDLGPTAVADSGSSEEDASGASESD